MVDRVSAAAHPPTEAKPAWADPAQHLPWPSMSIGTEGPVSMNYARRCIEAAADVAEVSFDAMRGQHLRAMRRQRVSYRDRRLITEHVEMVEDL